MAKEKPRQGGEPIRGDTLILSQAGFSDSLPLAAIHALEQEAAGLMHGTVTLAIHIKDGHLVRYTTSRERSFVPGRTMTGSTL